MIQKIVELSRNAGDAILEFYNGDVEVIRKDDDSPLTKADLAAHRVILTGLSELDPSIPVISEEGGIVGFEKRKNWNRFWLVDPLDGTKEFIKKNGEFTVNIALIEEGIPVLGVVHIPARNLTYTGEKGAGSFKIDPEGNSRRIYSAEPDVNKELTVITSRSHGSDDLEQRLSEQNLRIGNILVAGSSMKFCYVAEGKADLYPRFGPTMEWDTAAGDAVYRYSGRNETRKSSLKYNKPFLKNEGFIVGV